MRRTRLDQARLLSLIEQVYAAVENARLWEPCLLSVADAVAGSGACLISHDLLHNGTAVALARVNPETIQEYNEYYHQVDAWAIAAGQNRLALPGRVLPDQAIVERGSFKATEYYPFVCRHGISRLLHTTVTVDARGVSGLGVYRTETDPPFDSAEADFLQALAPHFRRALRMHAAIGDATHERQVALDALDAATLGVLLVTGDGEVVHANRTAAALLGTRDGLWSDRAGLTARTPAATAQLRTLIADCARTSAGEGLRPGGALRLSRPSGARDLQAYVCPVRQREPFGLRGQRVGAVVLVHDPDRQPVPDSTLLQTFYGLTPAEADVAARLASGVSLEEISESCGYTKQTVQWYSKQILSKTGATSRTALVRELSTTPSALGRPASEAN